MAAPFDLVPLGDGTYEFRAFSDDSDDPIVLTLDPDSGSRLRAAVERVVAHLASGGDPLTESVDVGTRSVTLVSDPGAGTLKVTVTR